MLSRITFAGSATNYDLADLGSDEFGYFDEIAMGGFLRDVMDPCADSEAPSGSSVGILPDILDFTFDDFVGVPTIPSERAPSTATRHGPPAIERPPKPHSISGTVTRAVQKAVDIGQQAFRDSMWQWTPAKEDHRKAEQIFLALSDRHSMAEARTPDAPFPCRLSSASRDRIMGLILRLCDRDIQRQIVTCFPSVDLLSAILEKFTSYHSNQILPWIHLPTLNVDSECEEFLLSMTSFGAAHSRIPEIRKLGFAMQETLRLAVSEKFEEDNRNTRDLRTLQTFALQLHVGLWSGIRRKIEIAESFALPFVTMLRRGGQFRKKMASRSANWRQWADDESYKRLAFHAFLEDTCTSLCLLNPPLVMFTEINLELPCSSDLWQAESAEEWQRVYQAQSGARHPGNPTLRACLADMGVLSRHQASVDVQMSFALIVSTVWSRVWQWRQMRATALLLAGDSNTLTLNAYRQEIVLLCKQLALRSLDFDGGIGCHAQLMLELCQMHLHVSLEDIQLFAGKEGPEEARKTLTLLRSSSGSPELRQAVYHAGQVIKAAFQHPYGSLKEVSSVGVYHASLVMWAYAVLTEPQSILLADTTGTLQTSSSNVVVRIDMEETQDTLQRFLMLGKGKPGIGNYTAHDGEADSVIPLTDPMGTMNSIIGLLASKNGDDCSSLPFVNNISKMIRSLGKAASVLRRSRV
jgi:hypothetical protein